MILGDFQWRNIRVEVEEIRVPATGSVVWLNEPGVRGLAVIRDGRFLLTPDAPRDTTAGFELEYAYRQFREAQESGASI